MLVRTKSSARTGAVVVLEDELVPLLHRLEHLSVDLLRAQQLCE